MSLGSWDPDIAASGTANVLQDEVLQRFIGYDRENQLQALPRLLDADETQRLAALMKIDHATWQIVAEPLTDAELIHLIRFFAVAENLPGWEAGAESPVIPLAKALRQRGTRLETALLAWLREVSDNRYLPYGPL